MGGWSHERQPVGLAYVAVESADIIEHAVAALHAGELAVLPTDTVYGLVCGASGSEPTRRLYRLKGRE